ncbi:hypothetical protein COCC4DRAFT_147387 [Bipolaris maydis ATCC 48331]|uniref:Transposase IS30-like HTH domain-containing protein n=1 Tax=Cochliobolus heterostrophus (strain C4 / ATCC 48331 / race T) TaxID=665024 RepID=N4WQI9_COCH4|nr:uncharacterized protein COCC4DRAFT_147387 [Bipolaris maydis ATCC 48331]ENI01675.1 hypothetical protein COCC4DRAFT_147387 [Bipolaris maydis ATCC 48331]
MTMYQRDITIRMLQGGATLSEVATKFGRAPSTIHRLLYVKFSTTTTTCDRPRSGRPSILLALQKKIKY